MNPQYFTAKIDVFALPKHPPLKKLTLTDVSCPKVFSNFESFASVWSVDAVVSSLWRYFLGIVKHHLFSNFSCMFQNRNDFLEYEF